MIKEPGPLAIFETIAAGYLHELAGCNEAGDYLDGADTFNGASYPRRVVVLAAEDLKQKIEAPLPLAREASSVMHRLNLNPIPELKFHRDIATAILRIDAVLHLARRQRPFQGAQYHA